MKKYWVNLQISREEYLKLYRGTASQVAATSIDGIALRFPASALKSFVSHDGVEGLFCITVDDNNKLLAIDRNTQGKIS